MDRNKLLCVFLLLLLVLEMVQAVGLTRSLQERAQKEREKEKERAENEKKDNTLQSWHQFQEMTTFGQSFSMTGLLPLSRSPASMRLVSIADINLQDKGESHALLTWFSLDFQRSNLSFSASSVCAPILLP